MRRFTELYLALDETTATGEKAALMERYLREAPAGDAAVAMFYLTGERPKRLLPSRVLREAVLEATGLPGWLVDECYNAVGDFSETAALLLPGGDEGRDGAGPGLAEVFERFVLGLGVADEKGQHALLREAWGVFTSGERLVFHKMIRGGLRVGVQRAMVVQALARATGIASDELSLRLTGGVTPTAEWMAGLVSTERREGEAGRAYPFFLASPLEQDPAGLGDVAEWQVEWKYDGIRAQLIRRGEGVWLWSRGEESIGTQFPEIVESGRGLPVGTVLDGEVLVWQGDRPATFATLQTRLNRKRVEAPGLFDTDRVVFVAFDVLEQGGMDVRQESLLVRRGMLESLVGARGDGTIRAIKTIDGGSWERLAELRATSRERGVEGLMLKHRHSTYHVGRTRPGDGLGWWKWKVDPYSVDAVLVYAQAGSGRRAGLHTDCTFALWESRESGARLLPFAKAYSGLTQEEIERLDAWILRHTVAKRGPVREVEPVHVFEIGFEGLAESGRHKSGIAVRFPRILKWRTDKRAEAADTLDALRGMLRARA